MIKVMEQETSTQKIRDKFNSLSNNQKLIILVILLALGGFYWFQVRPSQIKSYCAEQSKEDARSSLKKKAEIDPFNKEYQMAVSKNMYLKEDLKDFYEDCLHLKGL